VYPYAFCASTIVTLLDSLKWKGQYTEFQERDRYLEFTYRAAQFLEWEDVEQVKRRMIVGYEEDKCMGGDGSVVGIDAGAGLDVHQWHAGMMGIQVKVIGRSAI
jgi:hypothetical protein